ncbi:hypothetical protein [Micromonospora sp. PLK6-60]|nr:hypothetical protein [Micromonospora sp. PLK6-60]
MRLAEAASWVRRTRSISPSSSARYAPEAALVSGGHAWASPSR